MIDPANVPAVQPDERLARYVVQNSHIRRSNMTVKADAFVPHPYQELSVTRHFQATEAELWQVGEDVAAASRKTLHGRADIDVKVCLDQTLSVNAVPVAGNPNHADVVGWPQEKPEQKIIALELAAAAVLVMKG